MYERFDEGYDEFNGGALYVDEWDEDGIKQYNVAGILFLDGGQDDLHYFAFVTRFEDGDDLDGIIVNDFVTAAEAFDMATDMYVEYEIGWFATGDEAEAAVEAYVEGKNEGLF